MTVKSDVAALFIANGNEWHTASQVIKGIPQTNSQTLYAMLSMLAQQKFLESKPGAAPKCYRLTPSSIEAAKQLSTVITKKRKTKVFWTEQEKEIIANEVHRLQKTMRNQPLYYLANRAQEAVMPPERRQVGRSSTVHLEWLKTKLELIRRREAAESISKVQIEKAQAKEAPTMEPLKVEPLSDEQVEKLNDAFGIGKPGKVELVKTEEPTLSSFTTGQIIDEMLGRAGKSLKAGILDILGSPQVAGLVKSFWSAKPEAPAPVINVTVQAPDPQYKVEAKQEGTQPPKPIDLTPATIENPAIAYTPQRPKFGGAGPYLGPEHGPSQGVIRHHNPFPPQDKTVKKLDKVLIVGLLKTNHVQEVKEAFSEKYDLRFHHPDEADRLLKSKAQQSDRIIVLTEQISHRHLELIKSTGSQFEIQTGSIGRLLDYLSKANTTV